MKYIVLNTSTMNIIIVQLSSETHLTCCLKVCRCRIGSKMGSNSSPTFSNNTGVPKVIEFSSMRIQLLSDSLIVDNLLFFSIFLIHLFACPEIDRIQRFYFYFLVYYESIELYHKYELYLQISIYGYISIYPDSDLIQRWISPD